jgi:hypothetical protein
LHLNRFVALARTSAKWTVIHPPDARTSHLRTLSKIVEPASAPVPSSPPKCPREPHIIPAFPGTSTPREEVFRSRGRRWRSPFPVPFPLPPRQGAHCAWAGAVWEGGSAT